MQLQYSHPSDYVNAKIAETETAKKQVFPTKLGDFFPYADRAWGFWSGYFTSRPALKRYVRSMSNRYQIFKTIQVL